MFLAWPFSRIFSTLINKSLTPLRYNWCKGISLTFCKAEHSTQPKEISIPVPWGHIAGVHWNEQNSAVPIICLHGWKDNAASFNRLIPGILAETSKYQFICIDLPGHGFSSHYPPGMMYTALDGMVMIRRLIRHFGVSEDNGVHLLGHSLGAIYGFLFAATHPSIVNCHIAIDALLPVTFSFNAPELTLITGKVTSGILEKEQPQSKKPGVPKEEIFESMLNSHMTGINRVACEELIKRGIVEDPIGSGKYRYSHDSRIHYLPLMEFGNDHIKHLAIAFRSNLLHIKAENGVNIITETQEETVKQWIAKSNKRLVRYTKVKEAIHHVHLSEPEKIVPDILKFLSDVHSS